MHMRYRMILLTAAHFKTDTINFPDTAPYFYDEKRIIEKCNYFLWHRELFNSPIFVPIIVIVILQLFSP